MATQKPTIDPSTLQAFSNTAAGHEGVQLDESGEMLIKPSTQSEIDFYQNTLASHPEFAELMPTFMGTLSLGSPALVADPAIAQVAGLTQEQKDQQKLHGAKIATETAIVLENLEAGFKQPNVLDLKLGAKLYAPGTDTEKAARLDKVAAETTSGSLNFRIAGMKVWNPKMKKVDTYDKFYGRTFKAENVNEGFETFFSSLYAEGVRTEDAAQLLETILAEITKARHILEKTESRMFSASVLIVYEGDADALNTLMGGEPAPRTEERAPTKGELKASYAEEDEEEEEGGPPTAFKVKLIDFAHAAWTPGQGKDENVITGLKNVEKQMDALIAKFD